MNEEEMKHLEEPYVSKQVSWYWEFERIALREQEL